MKETRGIKRMLRGNKIYVEKEKGEKVMDTLL